MRSIEPKTKSPKSSRSFKVCQKTIPQLYITRYSLIENTAKKQNIVLKTTLSRAGHFIKMG